MKTTFLLRNTKNKIYKNEGKMYKIINTTAVMQKEKGTKKSFKEETLLVACKSVSS